MTARTETVLITGASAGIGRALATVFAENDFDLVLVARSQDKLRALADELAETFDVGVTVIPADLSDPLAPKTLFDKVRRKRIHVDVLVNNAGVSINEPLAETDPERLLGLVQVNAVALTGLTRYFLPAMMEAGHGRILNVASIVSFFPTPGFAAYGATKAYVLSLTEALSQELRGTGVTVTALCPGYTETDMIHGAFEHAGKGELQKFIPSAWKLSPEACAREGFKACMKGKTVAMDRLSNELTAQWVKWQPRWVVRNVTGFMRRFIQP